MRWIFLCAILSAATVLAPIYLRPDVAQRILGAGVHGAVLAWAIVVILWLVLGAGALVRKLRSGWRPHFNLLPRAVVSIWLLWILGVWLWAMVVDWEIGDMNLPAVMFGPPAFFTVTIFLARWGWSARADESP
jgi:hypothetical protein